jgi:DNA-directed RNA polymerase specialized sigma24 family protein
MLSMLSVEDRLALVLVDLLGFDAMESAESAEALRQRLSRARARCGVVSAEARCRCERQLAAKQAQGLSWQTRR